jgi:charged multivesicular body protein 4
MEQEQLNDRLLGADRVPVHNPAGPLGQKQRLEQAVEEDDEEEALRRLQAEMAM